MRTWQGLLIALAASAALATQALAADLGGARRARPAPPPPPPIIEEVPSFTWSGLYVGLHAGYSWTDIDWQETPAFNGSHDGRGWLGGAQLGYNWQAGRFVYGVEADISRLGVDGGNPAANHEMSWLYSVRGRLGLTGPDNRTLFYVTGGGAWADIDYASPLGNYSNNHFGWVIGGGIERALTPNMTARVEYLYYDFDSVTAPAGTVAGGGIGDLDPSMHTVRFGLNFKF
jgi:outer membrane immunogenic protein